MDFFESQELARRNTRRLVFLFVLAVIAIVVAIFALVVVAVAFASKSESSEQIAQLAFDWRLIVGVVVTVLSVIGLGSATKFAELRQGERR